MKLNDRLLFYYSLRKVCNIPRVDKPFIIKFRYSLFFNIPWETGLRFVNLVSLKEKSSVYERKSGTSFWRKKIGFSEMCGSNKCIKLWKYAVKAAQLSCRVPDIPALSYGIVLFAHHYESHLQHPFEIYFSLLVPLLSWKVFLIICVHLWKETETDRNLSEFQTLLPSRVIILCCILSIQPFACPFCFQKYQDFFHSSVY